MSHFQQNIKTVWQLPRWDHDEKMITMCYVWRIALYGLETWTLRTLERKYLEHRNAVLEEIGEDKIVRESN